MTRTLTERLWLAAGVTIVALNVLLAIIGDIPVLNLACAVPVALMTLVIWDDTR